MSETPIADPPRKVPLSEIFRVFFTVGASSFGGGVISWMHRLMVGQQKWLSNEKFLSGLALSQVLPGANVSNMAVYIGQVLRGLPGAIIALLAVLMGPFFLVIAVATVYDTAIQIPGFHSAMDGIAAAAVGMVLRMGTMGALHSCRKAIPALIALGVFIAIGIMQWPLAPVALVAAPLSVALAWPRKPRDA